MLDQTNADQSYRTAANRHWAVCQIFSDRAHLIRTELEKADTGTFLPTYVRSWLAEGKRSVREKPLMPGYLFIRVDDGWGSVRDVEGVIRVLANDGRASRVRDDEMARLMLGHASGVWDQIEAVDQPMRGRSRRPRPSRRVRKRQRAVRA